MKGLKPVLAIALLFLCATAFGQGRSLKKADNLYKLNNFAEAIPHYESALRKKDNLAIKTKLAYCYRMTNKMEAAEKLYAQIVTEERARVITSFYYGEALMGTGKYDQAVEWFNKYLAERPDDEQAQLMLKSCEKVKFIKPYFQDIRTKRFTQNSETDDSAPVFFQDGIVFCSDRKQGAKLLKQKSGWTGRDFLMVYFSKQNVDGTFEPAKSFSGKINALNKNTGPVTFNREGTEMVYTQNSNVANSKDMYPMQLYLSTSEDGNKWKSGEVLPFCSANYNFMHPALSPDGQRLFFTSDKRGGEGRTDIFVSERTARGWSRPRNLGPNVNTAASEGFPFVHADGKLYFSSKGHIGYGGFDIYFTEQLPDGTWANPINVGQPVNSSADDISIAITDDNQSGAFSSARQNGDDDIFLFKTSGGVVDATYSITLLEEDEEPEAPKAPSTYTEVLELINENDRTEAGNGKAKDNMKQTEVAGEIAGNATPNNSSTTSNTDHQAATPPAYKEKVKEELTRSTTPATTRIADNSPATTQPIQNSDSPTTAPPTYGGGGNVSEEVSPSTTQATTNVADNSPTTTQNSDSPTTAPPTYGGNVSEGVSPSTTQATTNVADNSPTTTQNSDSPTAAPPTYGGNVSEEVSPSTTQATTSVADNSPTTTQNSNSPTTAPPTYTEKVKEEANSTTEQVKTQIADNTSSIDQPTQTIENPTTTSPSYSEVNKEINNTAGQIETGAVDNTEIAINTPTAKEATPPVKDRLPVIESPGTQGTPPNNKANGSYSDQSTTNTITPTSPDIDTEEQGAAPVPVSEGLRINTAPDMISEELPMESDNTSKQTTNPERFTVETYTDLGYALSKDRVSVGQTFTLPHIKYPFNAFEYSISPAIATELDRLIEVMEQHPNIKVEIGGHTASFGENRVNKELSRERAQAAVDYLIEKGIAANRLVARGYGETKPLNHCVDGVICTRNQHLENQRLEMKVLSY
ncbi:MAG: OmpA family protein [Bacteroidota bacterium]